MVESEARPVTEDNIEVGRGTLREGKPGQIGRRLGAGRACGLGVESAVRVTEAQARQTVRDVPQPFPCGRRGYLRVWGWTGHVSEEEEIIGTA
jgi:hypothetical protein